METLSKSKHLFFTTSPRSPMKMLSAIEVLSQKFEGLTWNNETQINFMGSLIEQSYYEGSGAKDLAFAARDRINRGPKALGFIDLKPKIKVTDVGLHFLSAKDKEEVLLRQLLKFQLPSPYHKSSATDPDVFYVKPYLEMLRLIYHLGTISFDEVMLFGLQLTDYRKFEVIVEKIKRFRLEKHKTKSAYKVFRAKYLQNIILEIFANDIQQGKIRLRESNDNSLRNFVRTKASTMRDYTDACFRYLRGTGMVTISQRGKSLSIAIDKKQEVEFLLSTINRNPIYINDMYKYKEYLFDPLEPKVFTDDLECLINKILEYRFYNREELLSCSILELKDMLFALREEKKQETLKREIRQIKRYTQYDDIVNVYRDIKNKDLYDIPLMLEWNTWRAMTMLNGGEIVANLKFDDNGAPMSTAQGKMADIVCDYGKFSVTVEVTMSSGARQYEMEGEPVTRHLAKLKKESNKNAYCLFIAPTIHEACISHFYMLHKTNIKFYGGISIIVPIELKTFEKMLEDSYHVEHTPTPEDIERLFKYSIKIASNAMDEQEWYTKITEKALHWLEN